VRFDCNGFDLVIEWGIVLVLECWCWERREYK
jgi:hypothetical protein